MGQFGAQHILTFHIIPRRRRHIIILVPYMLFNTHISSDRMLLATLIVLASGFGALRHQFISVANVLLSRTAIVLLRPLNIFLLFWLFFCIGFSFQLLFQKHYRLFCLR